MEHVITTIEMRLQYSYRTISFITVVCEYRLVVKEHADGLQRARKMAKRRQGLHAPL